MSSYSKKIKDAEKLHDDYQNYFGGKYSAHKSSSNTTSIKDLWKLALASRNRLLILLGVWFFSLMLLFIKFQPRFVLQKRKTYDEKDKLNVYNLFFYSIVGSLLMFGITLVIVFRFPRLKNLLFNGDCDMCHE
jgi:hypothetical protein